MNGRTRRVPGVGIVALALVAGVAGCASVSQEQLDEQMAAMRSEIQADLDATSGRVTTVTNRVNALEARVGTLERDLAALMVDFESTVESLEGALRFSTPVHFAYDSDEVRPEDTAFLDRFASVVRAHYPGATITVEGFTDPAGSAEYNLALSRRRADAVMAYLTSNGGIPAERIRAVGYGEDASRLVEAGAWGPEGMQNRRVALVIDYLPSGTAAMD